MSIGMAAAIGAVGTLGALAGAFSGAFKESAEMVAALCGAILGTTVAASISIAYETFRDKKIRTLELIQEYNSPEFLNIRNDAGAAFRAIQNKYRVANSPIPAWNVLHREMDSDEWKKISKVLHYYKKLNFLAGLKELNVKYLSAFFSAEFWHWYDKYFREIDAVSGGDKEADFQALFSNVKRP